MIIFKKTFIILFFAAFGSFATVWAPQPHAKARPISAKKPLNTPKSTKKDSVPLETRFLAKVTKTLKSIIPSLIVMAGGALTQKLAFDASYNFKPASLLPLLISLAISGIVEGQLNNTKNYENIITNLFFRLFLSGGAGFGLSAALSNRQSIVQKISSVLKLLVDPEHRKEVLSDTLDGTLGRVAVMSDSNLGPGVSAFTEALIKKAVGVTEKLKKETKGRVRVKSWLMNKALKLGLKATRQPSAV